ncbi:Crp/Fnr family transcriptional regulator [Arundinibacter roseus]|uniref:Crp/Fnr family transcriptional regulator n=1 Tax=Arundinibacter roseus TaxID=2070510 RepID=A0A4R4KHG2_9BACT|nr:Crp/Fnr family transcriptional regulator [Arundinibacter roseus]TDB67468.1 Crp/Fnr family transcriptional regulator [Arundinibacter roseus]
MKDFLSKFRSFTEEEMEYFEGIGQIRCVAAKTLIFSADRPFSRLLFIHSGIIRTFRLIDSEDFSYYFFSNNDFAVDFQSYLTDTPSPIYFETLTDTTYTEFHKKDILQLYDNYPRFERLGRIMAEQAYLSAADRLKQHQTDDLKTRYLKLISKNPELFQTIPQHYIASYLGVKPQSLSRIRAELAGKFY